MLLGGRYRLIRLVARGGQADVHEAADESSGERVAIKVLRAELFERRGSVERLRREVTLAARVQHPNVARVHCFGIHSEDGARDIAFVAMEFLPGETLHARRSRIERLAPEQALPIVVQIAAGLAAAHAQNIIHRDLKPSNVMLVPHPGEERVVVTDFGLARPVDADDAGKLTATGEAVGTPQYMAPEQVRGAHLTHAADIYALGVVLFELVTGRLPFGDDPSMAAQLDKLLERAPPPRRFVPDLPRNWNDAISRCLEIEPPKRFHSTDEVIAALRDEPARDIKGRIRARLRNSTRKP
jgi:serine/threonine-protein kinase